MTAAELAVLALAVVLAATAMAMALEGSLHPGATIGMVLLAIAAMMATFLHIMGLAS